MKDRLIGKLRCLQSAVLVFFIIHGGIFGAGINLLIKISKEDFSKLYHGNDVIMMSEYLNYVENQDLKKLSLFYHFSL